MKNKFNITHIPSLVIKSFKAWSDDNAFEKSAATAYFALFSLPGLLLITVSFLSVFMDSETTVRELTANLESILGEKSAKDIAGILAKINMKDQSLLMGIIGVSTLVFGATSLFVQFQKALNDIWQVERTEEAGFLNVIKDRATSLGVIVMIGFLLLVSFIISAFLSSFDGWLVRNLGEGLYIVTYILNIVLSSGIITLLFAVIFKVLPDVIIEWKVVWLGAFVTAVLFTIGKFLISFYLSTTNPGETFGAAGGIILFLLWISYSCLILFFGVEFTQVYASRYGYQVKATKYARIID